MKFAKIIIKISGLCPQFCPNQADIQAILSSPMLAIFIKFHIDWVEIEDFLKLMA